MATGVCSYSGTRRFTLDAAALAELAGPECGLSVCAYTLHCLQLYDIKARR